MVKFFRKIRQQLLIEGKTTRYLKYAFGEIVLVVIGILIAIQANNWNIERIANKEQVFNLKKLAENLKQDTLALNSEIGDNELIISALDSCLIILKDYKNYDKDYFSRLFASTNYTTYFEYNRITFDEMAIAGKLAYIKNETLIDSLLLYFDPRSYKPVEDAIANHTRDNIRTHTLGFDFMDINDELDFYTPNDFNLNTKSLDDYRSDVRIINSLRFKILLHRMVIQRYKAIILKAKYLIGSIKQELNMDN